MDSQYLQKKIGYFTTALTIWMVTIALLVGMPYLAVGMANQNKIVIAIGLLPFFLNIVIFTIWVKLTRDPKLKFPRN